MKKVSRYLVTGFMVIIPVFLTISIFIGIFQFIDGILGRFLNAYLRKVLGFYIPGLGFLISILLVFLTGFFTTRFIGQRIFSGLERWFTGLPLIKNIYPTFKQIISFIMTQKEFGFKSVALVEYPSSGIWSIGFLTNERYLEISKSCGREMVSVFIPTTPSPLSGFVIFLPKEKVRFPDIPVADALKIIISGGVVKDTG